MFWSGYGSPPYDYLPNVKTPRVLSLHAGSRSTNYNTRFPFTPPPQSQRTKERKWYYFSSTLDREWYQLGNLIVASQLISTCKTKAEHMTCVVFQREWTCRLFLDSLRWRIKPEHIYYLWVSPKGSSWTKEDEPGFGSSVDVANPGRGLENPGSAFFFKTFGTETGEMSPRYLPTLPIRPLACGDAIHGNLVPLKAGHGAPVQVEFPSTGRWSCVRWCLFEINGEWSGGGWLFLSR